MTTARVRLHRLLGRPPRRPLIHLPRLIQPATQLDTAPRPTATWAAVLAGPSVCAVHSGHSVRALLALRPWAPRRARLAVLPARARRTRRAYLARLPSTAWRTRHR